MTRSFGLKLACLILIVSAALHFAAFASWPGSPDSDVIYSIFAASNFVIHGRLESINLYPQPTSDLASHSRVHWMTHWPPAQSWLYVLALWSGMSAGTATKALGLFCVLFGGLGWIRLTIVLGSSWISSALVGASYPWIFFVARTYVDYKNDHLACAIVPWICAGIVHMASSQQKTKNWVCLAGTALAAGSAILIKYSMAPVLISTALYYLWLEARPTTLTLTKTLRVATFSVLLLSPVILLSFANQAWGLGSYPLQGGGGISLGLLTFFNNAVSNTIGAPTGWSLLLIALNLFLEAQFGISLVKGTIVAVSLIVLFVWVACFLRRTWPEAQFQFLCYLCLMTGVSLAFLYVMTVVSGVKYNFAGDSRFYFPIGFAWIALGTVSLESLPRHSLMKSPRFFSLVVPLLFSFVYYSGTGFFGKRYATMPNSGIFWLWDGFDQNHASFISRLVNERGNRPDLLITQETNVMLEVGVPFYWRYRGDGYEHYSSTKNLEVWAMIDPRDEGILMAKFRQASTIQPVQTPTGFPFKFYILRFKAERGVSTGVGAQGTAKRPSCGKTGSTCYDRVDRLESFRTVDSRHSVSDH